MSEVEKLHSVFCEITGQQGLSLRFDRLRGWHEWIQCGWGEEDLRLVVRYLRRAIAEDKRNPGALKWSNLIGQPDRFEEDLYEARRVLRKPRPETVQRPQPLPGGGARLVESAPPDEPVDVGAFFTDLRKRLQNPTK
jgi:hypothetical protein